MCPEYNTGIFIEMRVEMKARANTKQFTKTIHDTLLL